MGAAIRPTGPVNDGTQSRESVRDSSKYCK